MTSTVNFITVFFIGSLQFFCWLPALNFHTLYSVFQTEDQYYRPQPMKGKVLSVCGVVDKMSLPVQNAALRVSQLDAAELDSEILSLTKSQLTRLFKYHQNNFLAKYDPEISAALKLLIWKFTIKASDATIGQGILNLKYHNEQAQNSTNHWIGRRQKILYALLLIGCPWSKDRSHDIIKLFGLTPWKDLINRLIHWLETGIKIATLVNFLVFLQNGWYLSLVERILGIRSVFPQKQGIRQVTFEYMTRELLWHGFAEFLFFILPLINFQRIKNFIVRTMLPKSLTLSRISQNSQRNLTSCAICAEWPIRAQEIGCVHVFCHYCIQSNFKADPGYSCPMCNTSVGDISNIRPVTISTLSTQDQTPDD